MFQLSSQWVPIMFSIAPHFYPICLGKCCPPFTNICGLKGRNYIHHNRTFYLEEFIVSFFGSNGLIKLAHWKNITKWTWEASHLINRRGGQEWTCWGKWNNECFLASHLHKRNLWMCWKSRRWWPQHASHYELPIRSYWESTATQPIPDAVHN